MCVTCGCSSNNNISLTKIDTGERKNIDKYSNKSIDDNSLSQFQNEHINYSQSTKDSENIINLEKKILQKNSSFAEQNRLFFRENNICSFNLVSSPGAGKTTLLTRTINDLKQYIPINVIEGDQETINDAKKIKETGCKVIQINTGAGCHLEALMVQQGYMELNPQPNSILMIENVGNLVCPALFDLGESAKIAILSITEGEDKPLKYPHMFRESKVMLLTKIDLLPYLDFNINQCLEYAKQVNPELDIFQVSSVTGEGLSAWYGWLKNHFVIH